MSELLPDDWYYDPKNSTPLIAAAREQMADRAMAGELPRFTSGGWCFDCEWEFGRYVVRATHSDGRSVTATSGLVSVAYLRALDQIRELPDPPRGWIARLRGLVG